MSYAELKALATAYPPQPSDALSQLAGEYHRRHEREILDLAAIAADVSVNDVVNLGLELEEDPQLTETLERLGYSEDSFDSLADWTEKQLEGHSGRIKGTYFEVMVKDKLNDGESIGDIKLQPGEVAKLAEDNNQRGWDIEITDRDGAIVEQVQLKAVDTMRRIKEALEDYPDIRVIAPLELEGRPGKYDR